jgi:Domain of unknown function (DUF6531)
MTSNLLYNQWKNCLICFLFYFCNTVTYGFERGPLIIAPLEPSAPNNYTATPQSACEHSISTLRGTPFYAVPGPNDADILSIWAVPHLGASNSILSYQCAAKVLRFVEPPQVFDVYANFVFPVCNLGDAAGGVTSDSICIILDNIPDRGANLGNAECSNNFVGNPINAVTGNKFSKETDIASLSGLGFSRSYNSNSLAGGTQIGMAWRHTYQRGLYVNPETVTATREDGRLAFFICLNLSGSINKRMATHWFN